MKDLTGIRNAALPLRDAADLEPLLVDLLGALFVFNGGETGWACRSRGHRAIGVVYSPDAERRGNYVPAVLDRRYDAFLWIDRTTPLNPLHSGSTP